MVQYFRDTFQGLGLQMKFLHEFLRRPRDVASVVASSRYLEQRLVEVAQASQARLLVELGPGVGGTTRALLEAMDDRAILLAIEMIPSLASQLKTIRDPRLIVAEADAVRLSSLLQERKLKQPDCIISGIPFSSLSPVSAQRLMEQIHDVLAPGGCFVAYQFRTDVLPLGGAYFGSAEVFREYRNLPPLWIYRWRKQTRASRVASSIRKPLTPQKTRAEKPRRHAQGRGSSGRTVTASSCGR